MAARKNKIQLTDAWKEKIRVSVISGRLYDHMNGEIEMSNTQIKAAQILLSKLVPDLARTEIAGDGDNPLVHEIKRTIVDPK